MATTLSVHSVRAESLDITVRQYEDEGDGIAPFVCVEIAFDEERYGGRNVVQLFLKGTNIESLTDTVRAKFKNVHITNE